MLIEIGIAFVAVAVLIFLFKLYVSFDTEGGAIGMVPITDGAIFPPLSAVTGLSFCTKWHWYVLVLFWLVATTAAWWLLGLAGDLGEKAHRKNL